MLPFAAKRKRSRNIGNPSQSQKVTNLLQDKGQGFTSRSETKEALIPDYECKRVEDLLEQEEEETNPVYIWDFGGQVCRKAYIPLLYKILCKCKCVKICCQ